MASFDVLHGSSRWFPCGFLTESLGLSKWMGWKKLKTWAGSIHHVMWSFSAKKMPRKMPETITSQTCLESGTEQVPQRTCATKILLNFRGNFLVRFAASQPLFYWLVPSNCSENSLVYCSARAPLCCKSMCCASRFCTGGRGAAGTASKQMSKGPWSKMLAQRNNLRLWDEGGSRGRSSTQDQKTRTVSTCWINPGGLSPILFVRLFRLWGSFLALDWAFTQVHVALRAMIISSLATASASYRTEKPRFPENRRKIGKK